jgi:hypothetical protein
VTSPELNRDELARYAGRVGDRWPLDRAMLGGAREADLNGAPAQRERGSEYEVVIVSDAIDGVPWLERVYQCANLWDASEMGARADVHCYTPPELKRKLATLRVVRSAVHEGVDLLALG